jgi:hypothetical protein
MKFLRQVICLLIAGLLFYGASGFHDETSYGRRKVRETSALGSEESPPEIVLLTHLLGGFKGLLVDAVWLRAVKLQEEQRFWELYQLYDWIGKLEPHLEKVWEYSSWNMAYNLVAEIQDSEERWRWIERALDYLRLDGLRFNPESSAIARQLAWIYHHKIGKQTDLHHFYYKHALALEMEALLGDRAAQDMSNLVDSPDTLAELLEDQDVTYAVNRIEQEYPDRSAVLMARLTAIDSVRLIPREIWKVLLDRREEGTSYEAYLKSPNGAGLRKIINFVAKRVVRERLGMQDLQLLRAIGEKFGDFDWRLPEPHAIYWATLAQRWGTVAKEQIKYDRLILLNLKQTVQRGSILSMTRRPEKWAAMQTIPDLTKIDPLHELYLELMHKYPRWDKVMVGGNSIRDGHSSFLQEAVRLLYFSGERPKAQRYFAILKRRYNKPGEDMTLKEYQLGQLKKLFEEFGTLPVARNTVMGMIDISLRLYVNNQFREAAEYEKESKEAWRCYVDYDELNKRGRTRHGGNLPSWQELRTMVVHAIMNGQRAWEPHMREALRRRLGLPENPSEGLESAPDGSSQEAASEAS